VDVTVTTPGGTSSTSPADHFSYAPLPTVTGVNPSSGPEAGGSSVTITGTNLTGATAVKFGLTNATSFTVNSATSITATSPSGAGTVDVTVTTPGGTSSTSPADHFSYAPLPTVMTEPASAITQNSATLNATVNPNGGGITECKFEYGSTSYGSSVTCSPMPGSGTSPVAVSASVSSLSPNMTYHFRVVAKNASGTSPGSDLTFKTPAEPVPPSPSPSTLPPIVQVKPVAVPNSSFKVLGATLSLATYAITFTESVADPGTFSWVFTFENGKFGVFAAAAKKCKEGSMRLKGRCRPAKVLFSRGSETVANAGNVTFRVRPTSAGVKALKKAFKQHKGLHVTALVTFQSAHGGVPSARLQSLIVKGRR
jgi:hypothetical protein